jgi:hypothetical protein
MKIELLYFEGCPSYEALLPTLRELLASEGIDDAVELRRVETIEDAEREHFLGSPTVRIDGEDVDPGARWREDFGLKCRLYRSEDGLSKTPPQRWIRTALQAEATEPGLIVRCRLDPNGFRAQRERYGKLGAAAEEVQRSRGSLSVRFGEQLDRVLLEETIAVETECCPFFSFDYSAPERLLRIGVETAEQDAALDALAFALDRDPVQGRP